MANNQEQIYKAFEDMGVRIVSGEQLEREGRVTFVVMDIDRQLAKDDPELAAKIKERTGEVIGPISFVIGITGLNTSIDEFYYEEAWQRVDLPPNVSWEHTTVANHDDVQSWLAAKNRWLEAAWTPNQSDDDRRENAQIMRDAEKRMSELEIK